MVKQNFLMFTCIRVEYYIASYQSEKLSEAECSVLVEDMDVALRC